jgi:predicted Zn finger-like uncharacterized protein
MPIQVACTSCAGRFRVPDNVAGKKIRCPKCKEVINVPATAAADAETPTVQAPSKPANTPAASKSTAPAKSAAAKPTSAKPETESPKSVAAQKPAPAQKPAAVTKPAAPASNNWFLKTEDGESYGPVSKDELDSWYDEGRVTIDCQVLREGSEQWQWASELYPELDPAASTPAAAEPAVSAPTPAASTPKPTATPSQAAPVFTPPDEPSAPASGENNPFAFLGGGAESGGGDFNFSVAPSSTPSTGKSSAKAPAKAATASVATADPGELSSKSKLTAGLLAIFLGSLGVHRFYLGYTVLGIIQLLLCGGCGIWQIIDVVLIFTGKLPDAQRKTLR